MASALVAHPVELIPPSAMTGMPCLAAIKLVKNNPKLVDRWLAGVTTRDGGDGAQAVKKHLGM